MHMDFSHTSVLLEECIANLNIRENGTYIDGTLGGAGHSSEILKRLGEGGRLIGIDQDAEAIEAAGKRLAAIETKAAYQIIKTNFVNLIDACREYNVEAADGILLDLGVSSHQFDTAERGFSYRFDAPLDMRMDRENGKMTAADVVNRYDSRELIRILKEYGEEKWANRIVEKIDRARKEAPIRTTFELVEIIKSAVPAAVRREGGHPAKKTFQAIRIEVNQELYVLERVLEDAIELLAPEGRLCVITFHSLEDRIVKNCFKRAEHPCECPKDFPICVCGKKALGKNLTAKPIEPSPAEMKNNPRSQSAKLRVFCKNGTPK